MGERFKTYERIWELMESCRWKDFSTLFSSAVEMHFGEARLQGRDQAVTYFQSVMSSFPDIKHQITSVIETPDSVAAEVIASATCATPLLVGETTVPVEGRRARFEAADLLWFRGDEVIRWNAYFNEMVLLRDLGVSVAGALS